MGKQLPNNVPRSEEQQIVFGYVTLLNRLDKILISILDTADKYDEDSDAGTELRVVHAQLAELMTKNARLRHRLTVREESP